MTNLGESLAKINIEGSVQIGAPLAPLTTFAVGGPADALIFPKTFKDIQKTRDFCFNENVPLFVMGKGANLLISDLGIRGVTLNLTSLKGSKITEQSFTGQAGLEVSEAIELCWNAGFSSLEFLYGMPSSLGGATWMNARCYGHEISEIFASALVLDERNHTKEVDFRAEDWQYKISPFQKPQWIILETTFRTILKNPAEIRLTMETNLGDRTQKGHFRLPCAGSVFKNDHNLGQPSGVIIDHCGLKGLRQGKAVVSDWHANIIVNEGGASAKDIRDLVIEVKNQVFQQTGHQLEEEIIYAGEWEPLTT